MRGFPLAFVLALFVSTLAVADTPGSFKNSTGSVTVKMKVDVNTFGDQMVTFETDGASDTVDGLPVPFGAPDDVESTTSVASITGLSGNITRFRVDGGRVQWENPHGRWINLRRIKPTPPSPGGPLSSTDDGVVSLPGPQTSPTQ